MATACGTWFLGLQVVGLVWSCGLCVWFAGYCSTAVLHLVGLLFPRLACSRGRTAKLAGLVPITRSVRGITVNYFFPTHDLS
jgi:hypothetical protein